MSDTVTFGNGNVTETFSTIDTLIGGTGNDTITFTGVLSNASVDLGGGTDVRDAGRPGQHRHHRRVQDHRRRRRRRHRHARLRADHSDQVDLNGGNNTLTLDNGANTGTSAMSAR